jgi:hypothetical protein
MTGRWERVLLAAIAEGEVGVAAALDRALGRSATRAELVAGHRAARGLAAARIPAIASMTPTSPAGPPRRVRGTNTGSNVASPVRDHRAHGSGCCAWQARIRAAASSRSASSMLPHQIAGADVAVMRGSAIP